MAEGTQSEGPGGGPPGGQARTLGLIAAGGALALAIGVAVFGEDPRPAPAPADPPSAVAPETPATPADPQASPAFGVAMADGPPQPAPPQTRAPEKTKAAAPENPDLEFLVRFDDRHPMSRAQALYLQGKHDEAETEARAILPLRPELKGLCFQRFTLGAELVLSMCPPAPAAQAQAASDRWVRKLRRIRGVQYVDANVVAQPEGGARR